MKRLPLLCLTLMLAACSGEDPESGRDDGNHVWRSQTDALENARAVGARADAEARRRERQLEEAGQ